MSAERMGVFWTFLDTRKFDKALKCIASGFQYDVLHPDRRTTLLVEAVGAAMCKLSEEKKSLELIKALRDRGASWTQACQSSRSFEVWKKSDPENTKITLQYSTHTALSFVQAWLLKFHDKQGYETCVSVLHKVLEIFLEERPPSRTKVAIDEDIVAKLRRSQVLFIYFLLARFRHGHWKKNRIPHHWVWQSYRLSHLANSSSLLIYS